MKTNTVVQTMIAAAMLLALTPLASAQQDASVKPAASQQQAKKPAHQKIWTDDDMDAIRTPEDVFLDQQREAAAAKAAAAAQAAAAKPAAAPAGPVNHAPPSLSNPKTVDSADKMIAWEDRDLAAQQEYVERLQKQLETAPADQQAHLQDLIKERTQVVADIAKEKQGLEAQKATLEQKAAAAAKNSTDSPSASASSEQ